MAAIFAPGGCRWCLHGGSFGEIWSSGAKAATREPITFPKISWFPIFFLWGTAWRGLSATKPPCRSPRPTIQRQPSPVSRDTLVMRLVIIITLLWYCRACRWFFFQDTTFLCSPFMLCFAFLKCAEPKSHNPIRLKRLLKPTRDSSYW